MDVSFEVDRWLGLAPFSYHERRCIRPVLEKAESFCSQLMVLMFFGAVEILLRIVGVERPASPRLVVQAIDVDISFSLHASRPRALLVADSRVSR